MLLTIILFSNCNSVKNNRRDPKFSLISEYQTVLYVVEYTHFGPYYCFYVDKLCN